MNSINQQAHEIIRRWIAALNEGKAHEAAALYADDAILLPTFSSRALSLPASRLDYFESLVARAGLRVELHDATVKLHPQPADMVIACGIYRFSFAVDGEPLTFEARFTMVLCPTDPGPIRHHHSSQVPRGLA